MGLDITAYARLTKLPEPPIRGQDCPDGQFWCRLNTDFPGRANDLEDRAAYSYERRIGFAAGSYSGYGEWREELAKLAGYPAVSHRSYWEKEPQLLHAAGAWERDGGPFWELINFADNEGVIGALVSAKLAKDFNAFQTKANEVGGWFLRKYNEWRQAFELAADCGAVDFH